MWALLKPTSLADVNVRYFLPALEKAVAGLPDDDRRRQMVRLLAGWDRMHDDANRDGRYDSPASAIMPAWFAAMLRATVAADLPADFAKFYLSAGYPTAEAPPAGSINVQPGSRCCTASCGPSKRTRP
jgi:penicillin amidase